MKILTEMRAFIHATSLSTEILEERFLIQRGCSAALNPPSLSESSPRRAWHGFSRFYILWALLIHALARQTAFTIPAFSNSCPRRIPSTLFAAINSATNSAAGQRAAANIQPSSQPLPIGRAAFERHGVRFNPSSPTLVEARSLSTSLHSSSSPPSI
jgi:hypothetical protein